MPASNTVQTEGTMITLVQRHGRVLVDGDEAGCILSSGLEKEIAVGDRVGLEPAGHGEFVAVKIYPRQTKVCRPAKRSGDRDRVLAANADTLVIVRDVRSPRQHGLVEQCLTLGERVGLELVLCVHKTDLVAPTLLEAEQAYWQPLLARNVACFWTYEQMPSAQWQHLAQHLADRRVVVIGAPGAGKTSLISALRGQVSSQAKPATTNPVLHPWQSGWLIDTPGCRDYGVAPLTAQELQTWFPMVTALESDCHYRSCTHTSEPDCAVRRSVQEGLLAKDRWLAYRSLAGNTDKELSAEFAGEASSRDYTRESCGESFTCGECGRVVVPDHAGTRHRNHCPFCLSSVHLDDRPGDRQAFCSGIMDPVAVWVRRDGEWAIIHRCRECGALSSNRIAADDNSLALLSLAVKPLSAPPFPLTSILTQT